MNVLTRICALTLAIVGATASLARTPSQPAPHAKPVVKTTCADYVAMNEAIKPQFIYYAVGHGKKGAKEAVFEEDALVKVKPELDQYCSVNLNQSAYDNVIASSIASEAKARHGTAHTKPAAPAR